MAKKLIVKFPNDAEYEQLKKDAYKHEMNISSYIRYLVAKERKERKEDERVKTVSVLRWISKGFR